MPDNSTIDHSQPDNSHSKNTSVAKTRQLKRAQRKALSAEDQQRHSQALCDNLIRQKNYRNSQHIACYLANDGEIDPYLLIVPACVAASCAFMLPVATPPNAIMYGSGHIKQSDMMRTGVVVNLICVVVLFALNTPIAIAIGTIVDMGIILTENIFRRLDAAPSDANRFEKESMFCILCGLCVRYCNEVKQKNVISFVDCGGKREINFIPELAAKECWDCKECFPLCPTSALQAAYVLTEALFSPPASNKPEADD